MTDELKPCPFCGSKKATIEPVFGASFGTPRFCVICSGCGADSQVDLGQSGAEESWNTRTIEDALRAERDAAVERLQEYRDDTAKVLNEKCPTDERHCGCVPILRKSNHCYRNALALITTMTDVSEMRIIADKALGESLADVSAAKACGEYWVQRLEQKAYEYDVQIIELENKVRELETNTYCAYCGEKFILDDQAASAVSEHIRICPKHPMRQLEARVAERDAALAWYADEKHYLRGAPGENTFPSESLSPMWLCDVGERARNALKGGE